MILLSHEDDLLKSWRHRFGGADGVFSNQSRPGDLQNDHCQVEPDRLRPKGASTAVLGDGRMWKAYCSEVPGRHLKCRSIRFFQKCVGNEQQTKYLMNFAAGNSWMLNCR